MEPTTVKDRSSSSSSSGDKIRVTLSRKPLQGHCTIMLKIRMFHVWAATAPTHSPIFSLVWGSTILWVCGDWICLQESLVAVSQCKSKTTDYIVSRSYDQKWSLMSTNELPVQACVLLVFVHVSSTSNICISLLKSVVINYMISRNFMHPCLITLLSG